MCRAVGLKGSFGSTAARRLIAEIYTGDGFSAMWQRVMEKGINAGVERFTFHDIRAKSASDDELASASERLGHTSQAMTKRVYIRKPTRVKPLR